MKSYVSALFFVSLFVLVLPASIGAGPQQPGPPMGPDWAFPVPDKVQPPEGNDKSAPRKVAGSTKTYTLAQAEDLLSPPDWFPEEHPAPPRFVAQGSGNILACGQCHLPTGMGHPESATVAGLPAQYFMHQMADMKSGARKTGGIMDVIAKAISEDDARPIAAYFASFKRFPYVKVVETATIPKSYVDHAYMRLPLPGGETEPLGNRIIVLPENVDRILIRDPHNSVTIANVPVGSIARGKELVTTGGGGTTIPCNICHGDTQKGMGDVPQIAGLQPIYIFRQLYSIQHGNRSGDSAALMKATVTKLSDDDMIAISAYLGTLAP